MDPNSAPQFNYKPAVKKGEGRFFIEPNFPPSGPVNRALAVARNSEIPEYVPNNVLHLFIPLNTPLLPLLLIVLLTTLDFIRLLREKGQLTEAENQSILYQHLKTDEVQYLGTEKKYTTLMGYLDPKSFHDRCTNAYNAAVDAQKMALRRDERKPSESKLEMILGGGKRSEKRCYTLGFTVNQQGNTAGVAPINKVMAEKENTDYVIRFLRLITLALVESIETIVSSEELDLVRMQREIDVPFTFGDTFNYLLCKMKPQTPCV